MKKISVVLPTYNEKENIQKTIEDIFLQEDVLPGYKIEVIVADSKSPDGTGEMVKQLAKSHSNIHLITVDRGIGVGLIKGHLFAIDHLNPDFLAQLDADGQVSADVLPKLIIPLENGFDLTLGSRFVEGGKNELSFSRRFWTAGSSWVCRVLMGPWDIKEFTNSARAFTPELFKKINLDRLPWKEKTFINQPAFLHEAILSGAKYKEVPLIFKDREEGYSKNKTFNYIYDILTYCIDARLRSWGLKINFYRFSHKAKTFYKFAVVGFLGTLIDFGIYNSLIRFGHLPPPTSKIISGEIAIMNNFTLNNIWTFSHRNPNKSLFSKFIIYNLVSIGGLGISFFMIKLLVTFYGSGILILAGISIAYYNVFFFVTIPIMMVWNFTLNHFITWKHKD